MGETITHETIQNESHGPVTALARRVHHILDNGGNEETLFCDYLDDLSYDSPAPVQPDENGFFPAPIAGKWKERKR